ncbi:MAG: hypothetical protein JXB04_13585 [Kiritimatiellae bacterium]|nr:hypothetical protein [Kiritimatiellia bacterium]
MERLTFHHPDWSLPVAKRRLANELLEMAEVLGKALATRGRSLTWSASQPTRKAYNMAVHRLRKAGLLAYRREGGKDPVLVLTEKGERRLPDVCRPRRFWNRKWNEIWYLLVYDVPESNRSYRNNLRGFLKRMRMGYLQDSVWVTPTDIRPEFDDLVEAAALQDFAFLFEARTVLGLRPEAVVRSAWNMDRLREGHQWYSKVCADNLQRVVTGQLPGDRLMTLAGEEMSAYLAVMEDDPLLPRALWPADYEGEHVYQLHREFQLQIRKRL